MSTSRCKSRIEPDDAVVQDSQVYFILEKYIVTMHFWNNKNNHGTIVLKKNLSWLMSLKALTPMITYIFMH
jgi:hypothetical protein